jgi:hypothetical protein
MDPHYEQFLTTLGALGKLVVLSIILERGLAFLFEHDWFLYLFTYEVDDPANPGKKLRKPKIPGLQGCLALAASAAICFYYQFDILAALFDRPHADKIGMIVTAVVAAGGSAGAIAIFQGFLNMSRDSREALIEAKKAEAQAVAATANARLAAAESQRAQFAAEAAGFRAQAAVQGNVEAQAMADKRELEKKEAAERKEAKRNEKK